MVSGPSDEELFARIQQAGDAAAFDTLYDRHKTGLSRWIARYLSDTGEAEDVFQEAFIQVLRAEKLDFTTGSFRAWLYLVARNLCRNRERGARRGRRAMAALAPESSSWPWGDQPSAESLLGEHQETARLLGAADGMGPAMSEVLNRRLAGQGNAEIARALGVPLGTVKSRFHAIMRFLKSEVD